MTDTTLRHKKVARREADDIKFIPYTRHVDDTIVALEDGSLMRMYRVDGRPFETSDIADLNTWHNKLNITWRSIGDDRVALWTHLVRTATDPVLGGDFHSAFARTNAVAGIPLARLADRRSRVGIVAWGLLAWSVLTAMQGVTRTFGGLLAMRAGSAKFVS